jgi:6,7-dimethyl-8-ribityllumazine synthase
MKVSLEQNIPVIFGVLATENEKQVIDRVRADRMNKGKEFADAAVEMTLFHV